MAASLPFWQQAWYVGPIAAAHPQLGDVSYFIGFAVAFAVREASARASQSRP
jgi:NCS1 family nucleobase:cation symporter-1